MLARERAAKMAAAEEAARKKLENKLEKTKKELDKWEGLSVAPAGLYIHTLARAFILINLHLYLYVHRTYEYA